MASSKLKELRLDIYGEPTAKDEELCIDYYPDGVIDTVYLWSEYLQAWLPVTLDADQLLILKERVKDHIGDLDE